MNQSILPKQLEAFHKSFAAAPANRVAQNAVAANGIHKAARNVYRKQNNPFSFSVEVESGEITSQKASGRCWMFASLNVMRLEVMKKLNLESMELSQNYPLFFDKLEKANYFLENMIETIDEPVDGRVISFLLQAPMNDGGQWDMFRSLVAKYGVVPKDVIPETEVSSATREMNNYLTKKLREFACTFRKMKAEGKTVEDLRAAKDEMMDTVYRILAISLGEPPKRFTWETRDKDKNFIKVEDITPQEFFAKYVGWDLDEHITVINAPTKDKPYGKTYTVQYLGNVKDGKYPVKYLNLPMDDLRDIAVRMLKDGKAVWFGCDVGQFSEGTEGYLCMDAFDLPALLSTTFNMTKEERLDFGESVMTHAMVLTGVDLDENGKPIRWKVENSWGDERGKKGFFVMDDTWFGEFSYQILLERSYFSEEQKKAFEADPILLKPWDPMGSLAL